MFVPQCGHPDRSIRFRPISLTKSSPSSPEARDQRQSSIGALFVHDFVRRWLRRDDEILAAACVRIMKFVNTKLAQQKSTLLFTQQLQRRQPYFKARSFHNCFSLSAPSPRPHKLCNKVRCKICFSPTLSAQALERPWIRDRQDQAGLLCSLGGREAVFHEHQRGIDFVVVERRTAGFPSFSASGGHAIASALGDQAALELRDRPEHMETPVRRRRTRCRSSLRGRAARRHVSGAFRRHRAARGGSDRAGRAVRRRACRRAGCWRAARM